MPAPDGFGYRDSSHGDNARADDIVVFATQPSLGVPKRLGSVTASYNELASFVGPFAYVPNSRWGPGQAADGS